MPTLSGEVLRRQLFQTSHQLKWKAGCLHPAASGRSAVFPSIICLSARAVSAAPFSLNGFFLWQSRLDSRLRGTHRKNSLKGEHEYAVNDLCNSGGPVALRTCHIVYLWWVCSHLVSPRGRCPSHPAASTTQDCLASWEQNAIAKDRYGKFRASSSSRSGSSAALRDELPWC